MMGTRLSRVRRKRGDGLRGATNSTSSERGLYRLQSSTQPVFAEHFYGTCLRSLFAHLLEKRYACAGRNLPAIEEAVLVKIDLAPILRLEEAETGSLVKAFHGRDRRTVMGLDMAPHATRMVREPPPRALERVIQGHHR